MSSPVAELEAGLQAMLALKAPGVTGSRITSLTALAASNIQSESVLIQKLYTHFKKAPATHKLGVLYVVDAVVRKWTDLARSVGDTGGINALDGSYGAGVNRIREILPVLMNDIIASAPKTQQDKIEKLVEIWEKGQTFPAEMLRSFKDKLHRSTTPPGSPSPEMRKFYIQDQATAAPSSGTVSQNTSTILEALANMARQNTAAETLPSIPAIAHATASAALDTSYSVPHTQTAAQHAPLIPYQSQSQTANVPAPLAAAFGSQPQNNGLSTDSSIHISNQTGPPVIPPPVALTPDFQRQFLMLKTLADAGVPQAQWAGIIAAISSSALPAPGNVANLASPPPPLYQSHYSAAMNHQPSWVPSGEQSRDSESYAQHESLSSQHSGFGKRSRSRSPPPERGWKRDSPTSPRRGVEEDGFHGDRRRGRMSQDHDGRGRDNSKINQNDYRQRSPIRNGRNQRTSPPSSHWIQFDSAVPKDCIRVLSRTLFIGGVICSEPELRRICSRFGKVQTCVVNKEKRHAFVKMINRKDAVLAKEGMERLKGSESKFRSTRWGVGFGPRDCSDYHSGISIIPVEKLTDADKKWLLTAEYGGTGGQPIQGTMVVEEPDIEVGQGVSSKAISRRLGDDAGNWAGSRNGRESQERDHHHQDRRRQNGRNDFSRQGPSQQNPNMMPLPGYGFPAMPLVANGMPVFPPFATQAPDGQLSLPPGRN